MEAAMKILLLSSILLLIPRALTRPPDFKPPAASAASVRGVPWSSAQPVGDRFRRRFLECETSNTCDGNPLRFGCSRDPNNNTALLKFPNGEIFFDAKMGVDADGSPLARHNAGPTDQPETSFRFDVPGRPSVDSDKVPYVVIPLGGFDQELGVGLGDLAAVVFRDRTVYALVADLGPKCKIGEGSIELHEELGHHVCTRRNSAGECTRLRDVGLERNVLYFIFPNSKIDGLTPDNAKQRIAVEGERRFKALRGQ